jgi:hypothetical protein
MENTNSINASVQIASEQIASEQIASTTSTVVQNMIDTFQVPNKPQDNDILDALNQLFNYIKSIHGDKITPSNIILISSELIQIVEKYKNFTGTQKKMLVINTIKKIVNEQVNTPDEKNAINVVIDSTLPNVIDGFISAINGVMKFTKDKKSKLCKLLSFLC